MAASVFMQLLHGSMTVLTLRHLHIKHPLAIDRIDHNGLHIKVTQPCIFKIDKSKLIDCDLCLLLVLGASLQLFTVRIVGDFPMQFPVSIAIQ